MKTFKILLVALLLVLPLTLTAQDKVQLYNPELDGMEQIKDATKKASESDKHVLLQVGGNWCGWCIKFHNYIKEDAELTKLIEDNYIVVKLNWSPENRNEKAMKELGNPGRFGYPVFVILDKEGKRIHTQDSGLLEEDKGYSKRKVTGFLKGWAPGAF